MSSIAWPKANTDVSATNHAHRFEAIFAAPILVSPKDAFGTPSGGRQLRLKGTHNRDGL